MKSIKLRSIEGLMPGRKEFREYESQVQGKQAHNQLHDKLGERKIRLDVEVMARVLFQRDAGHLGRTYEETYDVSNYIGQAEFLANNIETIIKLDSDD